MSSWRFVQIACLAVCGVLVMSAPAAAAPKRITGKLAKRGYTVIAVAADGEGKAVRAKPGFSLRPPASRVTLHLQAPGGVYAGPIVVGRSQRGKRAIIGVKAGTRLGTVRINSRAGYAKPTRAVSSKRLDTTRWARASKGIPIGAAKFGLVRSRIRSGSPPGDLDADGIADSFDIDDDGNLVIDRYEQSAPPPTAAPRDDAVAAGTTAPTIYAEVVAVNPDGSVRGRICTSGGEATANWPAGEPPPIVGQVYAVQFDPAQGVVVSVSGPIPGGCPAVAFVPKVTGGMFLTLAETVNANATALSVADLDNALARRGFLWISGTVGPGLRTELDCGGAPDPANPAGWSGGLGYCTRGGTGRAIPGIVPNSPPRSWPVAFPDAVDTNGNGFGEIDPFFGAGPSACGPPCVEFFFSHGATTKQIGTGDVLNWRVTVNGEQTQFPTTLPDVLATVPALVSYRDGVGNSGTVTYPVPPPFVGSGIDYFTESHGPYEGLRGFPVDVCRAGDPAPCVEGDVVITLTFWRPQREAIPNVEQGPWTDIGGLVYSPGVGSPGQPAPANCRPEQISTTDGNLTSTRQFGIGGGAGFRDAADDAPADPRNTLSFSVNLSKCLAGWGWDRTWDPGESVSVWLQASTAQSEEAGTAGATQQLLFTRK